MLFAERNMALPKTVNHISSLMLRLGRDQDCYNFVRWFINDEEIRNPLELVETWCIDYKPELYPKNRFVLKIEKADAFESCDVMIQSPHIRLGQLVAITLLKMRLLISLKEPRKIINVDTIPPDTLDATLKEHATNPIIADKLKSLARSGQACSLATCIEDMHTQVEKLFHKVDEHNDQFWPALITRAHDFYKNPEKWVKLAGYSWKHSESGHFLSLDFRPDVDWDPLDSLAYRGPVHINRWNWKNQPEEEAKEWEPIDWALITLDFTYAAWVETTGALDVVKAMMPSDELEELMGPSFKGCYRNANPYVRKKKT